MLCPIEAIVGVWCSDMHNKCGTTASVHDCCQQSAVKFRAAGSRADSVMMSTDTYSCRHPADFFINMKVIGVGHCDDASCAAFQLSQLLTIRLSTPVF